MIAGTAFRIYAIHCLGKFFSTTVQIKKDHKVITKGPYRYLRHPSYTGAYMAMAGCAFFLGSVMGMIILTMGMLFVYRLRIEAEEKTLLQNFKDEYAIYCMHTYKMFPLFW
jgi:protein-S-isoprenylcysteine O-methyltransferase